MYYNPNFNKKKEKAAKRVETKYDIHNIQTSYLKAIDSFPHLCIDVLGASEFVMPSILQHHVFIQENWDLNQ